MYDNARICFQRLWRPFTIRRKDERSKRLCAALFCSRVSAETMAKRRAPTGGRFRHQETMFLRGEILRQEIRMPRLRHSTRYAQQSLRDMTYAFSRERALSLYT